VKLLGQTAARQAIRPVLLEDALRRVGISFSDAQRPNIGSRPQRGQAVDRITIAVPCGPKHTCSCLSSGGLFHSQSLSLMPVAGCPSHQLQEYDTCKLYNAQ
jgi:hypothetical protein